MSHKTNHRGDAQADKVRKAITKVTDLVLNGAPIMEIEAAQKEALEVGATDEEYSEAVWNARRTAQGMTP